MLKEPFSSGNVTYNLSTSQGVKGHYLGLISRAPAESEVLLPPGTRFWIKSVKVIGKSSIDVDAIILPTVPEQCC